MNKIEVKRTIDATAAKVFAEIANHEGYSRFAGVNKAELIRKGEGDDGNGLGAVRRLKLGAITVDEEILSYEPAQLMEYRITRMKPKLFNHILGRVELQEVAGKTNVTWSSEYEIPLPFVGGKLEKLLAKQISGGFAGMLKAVDKLVA